MKMKYIALAITLAVSECYAQTNQVTTKPTFINGTMDIRYNSRIQSENGKPKEGVKDKYTINVNVCDSSLFRGYIESTPLISGVMDRIVQNASLNYQIECDVVHPTNPPVSKNIGRMYGVVPIEPNGTYRYSSGSLKVAVNSIGRAQGFESKAGGTAAGRPLRKDDNWLKSLKGEAMKFTKQIKGKTISIAVKKYDKMVFQNHVMPAGPVPYYPEATVSGAMVYDYDRYVWHFQNVRIAYAVDGKSLEDKLTGTIRWVEQPKTGVEREGEYQFDVRVNEPPPGEGAVFAAASDESAFFQTDDSLSALTGSMKYRDILLPNDLPSSSTIAIDLRGTKLSRQQIMNLTKLILLSSLIPMNSE